MQKYGIAVDIGTTTITAGVFDIKDKKELAVLQMANPQSRFGQDIISRLAHCKKHNKGLSQLQDAVITCINSMVKALLAKAGLKISDIEKSIFVGNTAMEHFLLGVRPERLAQSPYISNIPQGTIQTTASKLGLIFKNKTGIYLLPIIKSFVGSDLTAGMLYTNLQKKNGANFLVDIGTSGEIALSVNGKVFVASTAAGPAFETANKGILGSDIIEAVAFMLKNGIIDKTGRVVKTDLAKISQRDIRKIQLAKAAIRAGLALLAKKAGVQPGGIKNLFVSGKFGNYIDKRAAIDIGLLPRMPTDKIKFVGNAAYKGAAAALFSQKAILETEKIAKNAIHVGLFVRKDFKEEFVKQMSF